jgi:hypothetical protein
VPVLLFWFSFGLPCCLMKNHKNQVDSKHFFLLKRNRNAVINTENLVREKIDILRSDLDLLFFAVPQG